MNASILKSAVMASALLVASSANALVAIDDWQLDTNAAPTGNGLTTGIGHLNIVSGISTVVQEVNADGSPKDNSKFTDFGSSLSLTYTKENVTGTGDAGAAGILHDSLTFSFQGLTGTTHVDGGGNISFSFEGFVGNVGDGIFLNNSNGDLLASFDLAQPSGGTIGDFSGTGGTAGTSTILGLTTSSIDNLFRDSAGDSLVADLINDPLWMEVVTTNTLSGNQQPLGVFACGLGTSGFCSEFDLTSEGAANLFRVPEPASLALLGLGLLGIGAARRNKRA